MCSWCFSSNRSLHIVNGTLSWKSINCVLILSKTKMQMRKISKKQKPKHKNLNRLINIIGTHLKSTSIVCLAHKYIQTSVGSYFRFGIIHGTYGFINIKISRVKLLKTLPKFNGIQSPVHFQYSCRLELVYTW